jgi:hypothetical protein
VREHFAILRVAHDAPLVTVTIEGEDSRARITKTASYFPEYWRIERARDFARKFLDAGANTDGDDLSDRLFKAVAG